MNKNIKLYLSFSYAHKMPCSILNSFFDYIFPSALYQSIAVDRQPSKAFQGVSSGRAMSFIPIFIRFPFVSFPLDAIRFDLVHLGLGSL